MTALRAEYFDPDDDKRRTVAALDPRHTELRAIVGELPPTVDRAVRRLLEDFAAGASVHLVPVDAELTTPQAADMLGLSRTYLVRQGPTRRCPRRARGRRRHHHLQRSVPRVGPGIHRVHAGAAGIFIYNRRDFVSRELEGRSNTIIHRHRSSRACWTQDRTRQNAQSLASRCVARILR